MQGGVRVYSGFPALRHGFRFPGRTSSQAHKCPISSAIFSQSWALSFLLFHLMIESSPWSNSCALFSLESCRLSNLHNRGRAVNERATLCARSIVPFGRLRASNRIPSVHSNFQGEVQRQYTTLLHQYNQT